MRASFNVDYDNVKNFDLRFVEDTSHHKLMNKIDVKLGDSDIFTVYLFDYGHLECVDAARRVAGLLAQAAADIEAHFNGRDGSGA